MIIDGKKIAEKIEEKLRWRFLGTRSDTESDTARHSVAFILFGENFVSRNFMNRKSAVAKRIGVEATIIEKPTMEHAEAFIKSIADQYDGIVVQLPLPDGMDTDTIVNSIPIEKDIDLLSAAAMDAYRTGESTLVPPVARAVFEILKYNGFDLLNPDENLLHKKILVIGNGKLVGAPVVAMLELAAKNNPALSFSQIRRSTAVTERTSLIKDADIIITGVGEAHFIKPDMIKDGVILIDAGTSEQVGVLAGDVDPACAEKAALMTPVPGGVGPVTIASLFLNLL